MISKEQWKNAWKLKPKNVSNESWGFYLLSMEAFAKDWDSPEDNEAWKEL